MPLANTGLVCRYYLDEAASGTSPTQANDASANAYHLTDINYGSGNLAWTEVSGNRGLVSSSTTGTQRARRTINDTSDALRDAMAGTQKGTIEVVIDFTAGNASGGRIFGINGRAGDSGQFILRNTGGTTNWAVAWDEAVSSAFTNATSGRHVLTIVVDTTQATQNDRIRFAINGGTLAQIGNAIGLNATLSLPSGQDLIAFNRESSGAWDRSVQATLFYAALYSGALSQTNITDNATILAADDDTPTGALILERTAPLFGGGPFGAGPFGLVALPPAGGSGDQTLTPSLYSDADSFLAATVTPGGVTLTPSLYSDVDSFFAPTVTQTLTPSLYSDADTFFAPTVAPGAVTLTPGLYSDADSFFAAIVSQAGGEQTLLPSLYSDADSFFAPTVTPGGVTLTPSLYSDPDTFFAASVDGGLGGATSSSLPWRRRRRM
jgi:hypothetical protein